MFARFREISQQIDHRQMIGASALYELNGIMIPFKTDDVRAQSELVRLAEDAFRTASGAESGGSVLNSGQVWHMLLHGEWQIAHATAIAESEWNVGYSSLGQPDSRITCTLSWRPANGVAGSIQGIPERSGH